MLEAFKNHLNAQFPDLGKVTSILAISGGLDSVVLAHLLHSLKINVIFAHCNFNLRATESDNDALFVEKLAKTLKNRVFVQNFDTLAFAKDHKISTQMAARELRYAWFEELRERQRATYILTAHHANDALETFLINLSRGSGIDGLKGIPEQNGSVLRPLLPFSREEIADYAAENALQWREDASNGSDKYQRNHLRHHAIPALLEAAPNMLDNFAESLKHLQATSALVDDYISFIYPKVVTHTFDGFRLNIEQLAQLPNRNAVLYELLKSFGFSAWDDIYALPDAQSGKVVFSETHRIIKDRDFLLLTEHEDPAEQTIEVKKTDQMLQLNGMLLSIESVEKIPDLGSKSVVFEAEMLDFPLTVRNWKEGDYFYPFGMQGKKKLSKYFKDEKFSTLDKEKVKVLCNGNEIIWIMGHRSDERYRVQNGAKKLLKFTVSDLA
ncbi:tRNA lysidine(34) synthetase TilS [Flavimarina sp. Hel_I_48]|uniref:tRNA lysidine(34) synthetase TilS n=1 Tax=Flavimarina sp. Hel_I_48 TaxID=1392488 RepID=UPI0004DF5FAB|nr:tRNA lysidine(34) synthetase TilS [Flavimarina sp. Hel_I_48]